MRKQLFYLSNQELVAYTWQGTALARVSSFDNDDAGRALFGEYLARAEALPAYLLVDVIEEDFQRDAVPHVTGRSRKALIDRRLAQMYRDTPFRHAVLQGRDKEGRKDDRYLFNALTNAELPKTWLAVMLKHAVPLAGMYSLASLSQLLYDKLKLGSGPVLLVSHQSSGLRQSFFQDGFLRFSRLTPLFDHGAARLVETFITETAKTRQFMASTRVLARGVPVQVVMLANTGNLAALQDGLDTPPDVSYQLLDIEQARQELKLGAFDSGGDCNPLYLAVLAKGKVPSHFPLRDQRHFYQLLQARMGLYGLSAAVALAAVVWAAIDVFTIVQLRREAVRLEQEAVATEMRFQSVIKNLPATPVTPHNMKSVVGIERMSNEHVPLPSVQMVAISKVLSNLPQIQINRMVWTAAEVASLVPTDPNAAPVPAPLEDFPPVPGLLGVPDKTAQVVLLEGEIVPFNGDYRAAIDSVRQLAAQLGRDPAVQSEITVPPIDTRPSVKLQSSASDHADDLRAQFTLKVTWRP